MPGPQRRQCRLCGTVYDPDDVSETFLADFEARTGLPFTGARPRWIAVHCSEACRYRDVAERAKAHNTKQTARRTAQRAAKRAAKSDQPDQ